MPEPAATVEKQAVTTGVTADARRDTRPSTRYVVHTSSASDQLTRG